MICINCAKALECPKLAEMRNIFDRLDDFSINKCENYEDVYKYRKIADYDELLRLLYYFFTGQIEGDYSDEEIIKSIKTAMLNL